MFMFYLPPSVNVPDISIQTNSSGTLTAIASGVSYFWQNGDTTAAISVSKAGNYCVTVTDSNNACVSSACGTVTIIPPGYTISGALTYDNTKNTPINNTVIHLLSAERSVLSTDTTDVSGNFIFKNTPNGSYFIVPVIAKAWGGANPTDALLINRSYIKAYSFVNNLYKRAADVNADGKINPLDALLINRRYIGAVKSFNAGNWLYDNDTVKVSGTNVVYNFNAECYGDVNGSFIPNAGRLADISINNNGFIYANPGETVYLPVRVSENVELGAFGLKLLISNQEFRITEVISDFEGMIYNLNDQLSTNNEQQISIAWSSDNYPISIKAGQTLLTLKVYILSDLEQLSTVNYQLTLDPESILSDGDANDLNLNILNIPKIEFNEINEGFSYSCYPNPFTGNTIISYQLPVNSNINITVYDVLGNKIRTLVNDKEVQGLHKVEFDAADLPAGVYIYRLETYNHTAVGRMVLMK